MGTNGWTIKNVISGESIQDTHDNDVVITLTDGVVTGLKIGGVDKTAEAAGSVTVNGNKLIIDPAGLDNASTTDWDFDWDFGANYHVSMEAGVVKTVASDIANAVIDGATSLNFTTVTPPDAAAGAASQAMNTATGALEVGITYHNAHVSETPAAPVALDFSVGKHAVVMQDAGTVPTDTRYRGTTIGGNVSITGFGADDLFYMENMGDVNLSQIDGTVKAGNWGGGGSDGAVLFRELGNIDNGLSQRIELPDYNDSWTPITNLKGADSMFENSAHWNSNVVIYA
jgi:hypothetical protein